MDDDDGPAAALWLVGDADLYLMSNGKPPLLQDGKIVSVEEAVSTRRLCAFAEGCGPLNEVDEWWPVRTAMREAMISLERFQSISSSPHSTRHRGLS